MYFDTHAHYDSGAFNADRKELLASMPQKGVELIVNPAATWRAPGPPSPWRKSFPLSTPLWGFTL